MVEHSNISENTFCRINIGLENWMIMAKPYGLGLNQSQSVVYARIFSVSYAGDGVFCMYQSDFTKLYGIPKSSFFSALKYLQEQNLIIEQKSHSPQNAVKRFVVNTEPIKKYIEVPALNITSEFSTIADQPQHVDVDNLYIASEVRTTPSNIRTTPSNIRTTPSNIRTTPSNIRTTQALPGQTKEHFATEYIQSSSENTPSTCTNTDAASSSASFSYQNDPSEIRTTHSTCENTENSRVFNNGGSNSSNNSYSNNIKENKIKLNLIELSKSDKADVEKFNAALTRLIQMRKTKPEFANQIADALHVQVKRFEAKRFDNVLDLIVNAYDYYIKKCAAQQISPLFQLRWLKNNSEVDDVVATLCELNPKLLPAARPAMQKVEKQAEIESVRFCLDNYQWHALVSDELIPLVTTEDDPVKEALGAPRTHEELVSVFTSMCERFGTSLKSLKSAATSALYEKQRARKAYPYLQKSKNTWYCQLTENSPLVPLRDVEGRPVKTDNTDEKGAMCIACDRLKEQQEGVKVVQDKSSKDKAPEVVIMPSVPKVRIAKG